jgi:lipoprotein-anchoring transpeptidase ErfK/SrfK
VTVVVIAAVMFTGAGVAASALHFSRGGNAAPARPTQSLQEQRAVLARAVSFVPKTNATAVAPDSPVVVSTAKGWLLNVRVSSADGHLVRGAMDVTGRHWLAGGRLHTGTTYRVSATVFDGSGATATVASHFRTLTVTAPVTATLFPSDGMQLGIAQPVVVRFDHDIDSDAARASVLSRFTITESEPVVGGWHWFSAHELHFRPRVYWPAGERVTVASDLDGWNAGDGRWGVGAQLVHFSIGDAHVSVANLATHQMVVRNNGGVVASYAISGGSMKYPTMNGTHIVMDRESVVHMVSSTVGIPVDSPDGYDELVYADVHISDSGEYVHSAPWSVDSQGQNNVSHGCINLSPADALAFFAFSRVGDVVQVVGGPRPPAVGDHGVMDWDTDWTQWTVVAPPVAIPPKSVPMADRLVR